MAPTRKRSTGATSSEPEAISVPALEEAAETGYLGTRPAGAPDRKHFTAPPGGDTAPSTADEPTGTDPRTGLPAKSPAAGQPAQEPPPGENTEEG